jgi:hypothetical protein
LPCYFTEIEQWFQGAQAPYGLKDINTFNELYQRHYPNLDQTERLRVEEEIVDALIEGVANPKLTARIYGVV